MWDNIASSTNRSWFGRRSLARKTDWNSPARPELRAIGRSLVKWARDSGATHLLTVQPSFHADGCPNANELILKPTGLLLSDYARQREDLPRRARVREEHLNWCAGILEARDRFGNPLPHLHLMIALAEGEEPFLRGFLRRRLGRDRTPGAAGLIALKPGEGVGLARGLPKPVSDEVPVDRRLVWRWGSDANFDLRPLNDDCDRLGPYLIKQAGDPDIINHLDLFAASGIPSKLETA